MPLGRTVSARMMCTGFLMGCLALSTMLAGCGPYRSAPVKVDVAHDTLKLALEQWQQGTTPDDMQKRSPKIVVQDMDWTSGAKLVSFDVQDGAEPVDANLVAKVKLKLVDPKGREAEKMVTYVVGTSPVLTVFRDPMR